jgi:hypothetical protein
MTIVSGVEAGVDEGASSWVAGRHLPAFSPAITAAPPLANTVFRYR